MNITDVQAVFERATPQVSKSKIKVAFLIGTLILLGAIVFIDYRKNVDNDNDKD